jgi:hypothetical protein
VTTILVVIRLVSFQLALQITLAPKECPIEKLSPYRSDQSLNESVRTRRAGNGLDLVNFKYSQVRSPAMKTEYGLVVG